MLENFVILEESKCIFKENYFGSPLLTKEALGVCGTISMMLDGSLKAQGAGEDQSSEAPDTHIFNVAGKKYCFSRLAHFQLLAQGASDDPDTLLTVRIERVKAIIHYFLGNLLDTERVNEDTITGLSYVIDGFLSGVTKNPILLLPDALPQECLAYATRTQLDRLLASLTNQEANIVGSVLLLGNAVLHTCLERDRVWMIALQLRCKPMNLTKVRVYPV